VLRERGGDVVDVVLGYNFGTPKRAALNVIKDSELMALSAFVLEGTSSSTPTPVSTAVPTACTSSGSCSIEHPRRGMNHYGKTGLSSMTSTGLATRKGLRLCRQSSRRAAEGFASDSTPEQGATDQRAGGVVRPGAGCRQDVECGIVGVRNELRGAH
jgi:hypothetical protein